MKALQFILIVFICSTPLSCSSPVSNHHVSKAASTTREIAFYMKFYTLSNNDFSNLIERSPIKAIATKDFIPILNIQLSTKDPQGKQEILSIFKNISSTDPRGNNYNIAWGASAAADLGINYYFLAWSNGPNGINEFGTGDDIYSVASCQK